MASCSAKAWASTSGLNNLRTERSGWLDNGAAVDSVVEVASAAVADIEVGVPKAVISLYSNGYFIV
jgi:hypothetical protein